MLRVPVVRWPAGVGAVLMVAAVAAAAAVAAHAGVGASGPAELAAQETSCSVTEVGRWRVVTPDGRRIVVDPETFTRSGDEHLLAGTPNYVFEDAHESERSADDSIFGVVLDRDGRSRLVEKPFAGHFTRVRAAAAPEGGWLVAFGEIPTARSIPDDTIVSRTWLGRYDGGLWSDVEEMPPLPEHQRFAAADLAVSRDTVGWPLLLRHDDDDDPVAIHYYHRVGGTWSRDYLGGALVSEIAFAHTPSYGFVLAAVRTDPVVGRRSSGVIHLMQRRDGWRFLTRVMDPLARYVHHPSVAESPTGLVATWTAQPEDLGERLGIRAQRALPTAGDVLTVDSEADYRVVQVPVPEGGPIWVTRVIDDVREAGELRFHRGVEDRVELMGSVPNPFTGNFLASWTQPDLLSVAGHFVPDYERGRDMSSLLLKLRVRCGP